ncbi:hypothetical protein EG346_01170 [Chryseobacterium carnipullorum]|uniref:Uncharacterized protein n=3 Tax=Chryseobacterium group TaxID=2782232 RepID=A0A376EDW5_CHRCU|nr:MULTISPECIES: hypothetical protein [Chryseobacterium group]AZA46910.1 hypothetical protein EG346_01170 [Chryseobacterium carnipullorum]SIT97087.1 hypothetical protein SAMN05660493_01794 [Epilithonimonas bovis DSM 19482]STD06755.1 Uncharacterised protein [Chryseobacterium carnipullorum]
MENQNQNEDTKSNGMELLENVIKSNEKNIASNEANIEQFVKVEFVVEDFINSSKHIQTGLRDVNAKYDDVDKLYELEQVKRSEFLANIPTKIETVLSQETIDFYGNFENKVKRLEKFIWSGIGVSVFSVLLMIISINFATKWYKESIKAKSELRQDILNEIAGEGKKIYDEKEIKILSENTEIMQLWIKNNPKKGEDFLRFKDGFDARKE